MKPDLKSKKSEREIFFESLNPNNLVEKFKNCEHPSAAILPILIDDITIEKISWEDFKAKPNPEDQYHMAFILWGINYTYEKQEIIDSNK